MKDLPPLKRLRSAVILLGVALVQFPGSPSAALKTE